MPSRTGRAGARPNLLERFTERVGLPVIGKLVTSRRVDSLGAIPGWDLTSVAHRSLRSQA